MLLNKKQNITCWFLNINFCSCVELDISLLGCLHSSHIQLKSQRLNSYLPAHPRNLHLLSYFLCVYSAMHSGNMTVTIIIKRNAKMLSGLGTKNRLFARATLTVFFFLTLTVIKADILRGPKRWTCQKQYYYVLPSDCVSILFCLFSPGQSAWGPCCTKVAVQGGQVKKAQGSGGLLLLLLYCHIKTLEIVRE